MTMTGRTRRIVALLAFSACLGACSAPKQIETPMLDTRNPELRLSTRLEAARLAWASAQQSESDRAKAREIFKSLVWSSNTPKPLRLTLTEYLLNDETPEGIADSKAFAILRLPTEPDRSIVGLLALATARHGWQSAAPSLVRRLADPIAGIDDRARVEARALARLHPDDTLEETVFNVFLGHASGALEGGAATLFDERTRADAWTVLSRLDPNGSIRRELVLDPDAAPAGVAAPLLADLRAGLADLRVLPSSAMELEWLSRLRHEGRANQGWWRDVSALVLPLDRIRTGRLELRNLEAIRIASETEPALLMLTRDQLFARVEARLEDRNRTRRTAEVDSHRGRSPERPGDWRDELTWGDLISILVIDDAVRSEGFARVMFTQAELDRKDRKTEYGGVIEAVPVDAVNPGGVRAVLFPPRPRDRVSDERFIASTDMLEYSDRALAHYHLQVQREKNYRYAGPSSGDLRYASLSGRNCVVFTSLGRDRLGVDYYQPDGTTIDLGEIRASAD